MKKLILLLVITTGILLITGCSNKNNIVKTEKSDVKTNAQEIFEMKSKCASFEANIKKRMEETFWMNYVIEEIFYSPIRNSCMYSVYGNQIDHSNNLYHGYMIWDYLTTELVFYRDTTLTNNQDISDIYQNAIDYLKGNNPLKYEEKDWMLD